MASKLLLLNLLMCVFGQEQNKIIETKECRERDRLVSPEKDDLYSVVDVVYGQTLILRCRFCNENYNNDPRNWFKSDQFGLTNSSEVKLDMNNDITQNRISVNLKHSLVIKNFSNEDIGYYSCLHYEDQSNPEKFNYLVDIVEKDRIKRDIEKGNLLDWSKYHDDFFITVNKLFKESGATEFLYLREILKIDAELITNWSVWGQCEACGRPQNEAIMKKRGTCRIKLTPHNKPAANLTSDELYLYNVSSLSCKSLRLQRMFSAIYNYTHIIPDFVQEDKCTAICNPDADGLNKGWKVGKTKGFKYKLHSILKEGEHLVLICPESSLDNIVVWKKNGKTLKRGDNSNPNVIVDTFDTLYLIEVTKSVSGNYTCYVDDIRMEQVVIYVYNKSKFLSKELQRYFIYLGFILFLSSFCYCGGLVIAWKKRHLFKTFSELREGDLKHVDEEMENLI